MNKKMILKLLIVLISPLALAQYDPQMTDSGTSTGQAKMSTSGTAVQHGFAGYLSANAGYSGYNNKIDVEGAPTSLKALISYVTPGSSGVFDAGFGVQNQQFSQKAAPDKNISTGVMEVATRYQFENRWQLGAVYNQFFNKGENYAANQADVEFGGIQILREFGFPGNYLGRVGGRLMTSLNVNNESVNMAIIDFQIGWGASGQSSVSTVSLSDQ